MEFLGIFRIPKREEEREGKRENEREEWRERENERESECKFILSSTWLPSTSGQHTALQISVFLKTETKKGPYQQQGQPL